jgi:hypothetical protein
MEREEQHRVTVAENKDPNVSHEKFYNARCSCGYEGRFFTTWRAADDDGDEHVIAMSR